MPKKSQKTKDTRKRVWCFEVYPDSAPKNWMAKLQDTHVKAFVSPLHDSDKHESGEPKKPHYHVEVMFQGKQTLEQVRTLFGEYASNGYVEPVTTMEGYARYLCHLDNPEKAQYQISDVRELNGADYLKTVGSTSDVRRYIGEMQKFCRENGLISFAELMDYAMDERPEWHDALCSRCSMVMYRYLRSLEYDLSEKAKVPKVDKETREERARRIKAESEAAKARAKQQEAQEEQERARYVQEARAKAEARKAAQLLIPSDEPEVPWANGDGYLSADTRDSGPDFVPPECN